MPGQRPQNNPLDAFAKCTDVRDRVYALLSLARQPAKGETFQADYSVSAEQLQQKEVSYCQPHTTVSFEVLAANAMRQPQWNPAVPLEAVKGIHYFEREILPTLEKKKSHDRIS